MSDPMFPEERVVREEQVVEHGPAPVRGRRTIIERRSVGGPGMNPLGLGIAVVLVIFILVLIFGFLL